MDLREIAREARDLGLPVWLILWPTSYWDQSYPLNSSVQPWTRTLGEEGVLIAGHALKERSCWGFRDLNHPSEAG